jgi:hypothetical protein
MLPPGTLVNAMRSALAFVIFLECFASLLSLVTPDEMPKADKATIKITERRKSLGFMIQVRLSESGDLDSILKPKIAEAFNASLNKIGKIVLPTFTSASSASAPNRDCDKIRSAAIRSLRIQPAAA